jgi:hypothetical protein
MWMLARAAWWPFSTRATRGKSSPNFVISERKVFGRVAPFLCYIAPRLTTVPNLLCLGFAVEIEMRCLIKRLTSQPVFSRPSHLAARVGIPIIILVAAGFFGIRSAELFVTFRPLPYAIDDRWNWVLPPNSEDVWFTTVDRVRLNGWFIHSRQETVAGTILYCHGNSGNLTHASRQAQKLAEQGFDVLLFDYRCYGRSEWKMPDERGINYDVTAAYDYLIQQRGVKPERLVIYGWSLGTTAAIDLAARRPSGALVVEAGLSSASDMAKIKLPWLPRWLHWVGKNRFASVHKIAQVQCPILVSHGTSDDVIPVEQGQQLYAAARQPKEMLLIPGRKHWVAKVEDQIYFHQVTEFISDSLNRTLASR